MPTPCTDADIPTPHSSRPVDLLTWLAVAAALVAVLYWCVDQPVLSFVGGYRLDRYRSLKWLTRPPEAFLVLSPVVLLAGLLRRRFAPWTRLEKTAVAAAVSTLCTALAVLLLKMTFGRSSDGFHPFALDPAYWAFPSGHTACTLSVTAVAEVAYPGWRWTFRLLPGMVAGMLIALNHHFAGDIVGGVYVGWAIGGTVARGFGLGASAIATPAPCPRHPVRGLPVV